MAVHDYVTKYWCDYMIVAPRALVNTRKPARISGSRVGRRLTSRANARFQESGLRTAVLDTGRCATCMTRVTA